MPWAKLVRKICSDYGWPPAVVAQLTPYQAYMLAGAYCPEDGVVSLTPGEMAAMTGGSARRLASGI